jgi:hypothetical protein
MPGATLTTTTSTRLGASTKFLPRYRLRTLLILVAVAGLLLGAAAMLRRRRARFLRLSAYHAARSGPDVWYRTTISDVILWHQEIYGWHDALAAKYRFAADHPWRWAPPDPPRPAFRRGAAEGYWEKEKMYVDVEFFPPTETRTTQGQRP